MTNLHDDTRILIKRCLFRNNNIAIYVKNQGKCDLKVDNSTFIDNSDSGIYVKKCAEMMVHLSNSTFRSSPVRLFNVQLDSWKWGQHFQVHIENSSFYGNISRNDHRGTGASLFQAKCNNASVLNISVVSSIFANFMGSTKHYKSPSAPIYIYAERNQPNITTAIYFNQVRVKNIFHCSKQVLFSLSLPANMESRSMVKYPEQ